MMTTSIQGVIYETRRTVCLSKLKVAISKISLWLSWVAPIGKKKKNCNLLATLTSDLKRESGSSAKALLAERPLLGDGKRITNCVCDLNAQRKSRHRHLVLNTHNDGNAVTYRSWQWASLFHRVC